MTQILTWNIQCGLGVDGRVDMERIAAVIRSMGDPDVICLQEVSQHFPELDGGAGNDQVDELSGLFPGYQCWFGPALNRIDDADPTAPRRKFGNLMLTRLPVLCVFLHHLPQPPAAGIKHMPRQAIEATVSTAGGALRIVTTHLEYHVLEHRMAQIGRLRSLHAEAAAYTSNPPEQAAGPYQQLSRPADMVLCGDFNLEPDSPEYTSLIAPFDDGSPALSDGWKTAHGERAHEPTCGIFDHRQWPAGPHCRDFIFVTQGLCDRIRSISVDVDTDASDHQPLMLKLDA